MVSQAEWGVINSAQYLNEDRLKRSQEFVGVLYFLLALSMLQVALLCGVVQGYVLPLRRFYRLNLNLANNKISSIIHCGIVTVIYFVVTGAAGASGYIFMSCLIGLWMLLMIVYIIVRKVLARYSNANKEQPIPGADQSSRQASHDFTRRASDIHASMSFDVQFESASFDQNSLGGSQLLDPQSLKQRLKKLTKAHGSWTACPKSMSKSQTITVGIMIVGVILVCCIFIGVFIGWKVKPYYLVGKSGALEAEYFPTLSDKSNQMLYSFSTISSQFQFQFYVRLFSEECGRQYTKTLSSDSDRRRKILDDWVVPFGVNMSLYVPSDVTAYSSVDQWLTRAINTDYRPLPTSEVAVIAPADCRLLVFEKSSEMTFYLKGYSLPVNALLDSFSLDGFPNYFADAAVAVARMSAGDYHRFHAPVSGKVLSVKPIGGTYWANSPTAFGSGSNVFLNSRMVIVIDAGPRIGYVAVVAIGATCIGSVKLDVTDVSVGASVVRGQPLGSIHFGGSTIVLLFSRGRVLFDHDMLQRSRFAVETRVDVNSEIGASR